MSLRSGRDLERETAKFSLNSKRVPKWHVVLAFTYSRMIRERKLTLCYTLLLPFEAEDEIYLTIPVFIWMHNMDNYNSVNLRMIDCLLMYEYGPIRHVASLSPCFQKGKHEIGGRTLRREISLQRHGCESSGPVDVQMESLLPSGTIMVRSQSHATTWAPPCSNI